MPSARCCRGQKPPTRTDRQACEAAQQSPQALRQYDHTRRMSVAFRIQPTGPSRVSRRALIGERWTHVAQFSSRSPGTRSKSFTLLLTNVRPRLRAWPAIIWS